VGKPLEDSVITLSEAVAALLVFVFLGMAPTQQAGDMTHGSTNARTNGGPADTAETIMKNPSDSKFLPAPGVMPECFVAALQRIDRATGGATILAKSEGPCILPFHWHNSDEQIIVVSGDVEMQMKDGKLMKMEPGGYLYLPAKTVHTWVCTGPCVHTVQSMGPWNVHYVNPAGDEIPLAEALRLAYGAAAKKP
jgi:mannose-6-phosphate isomerase-like protein (cupin superfamily)